MKSLYSIVLLLTAAASVRAAEGDRFASVAGSKKNGAFSVVHRTHLESLAKLVGELEATPEGSGSMMDNTLILYGSDNANWQHTDGNNWPFITIGNFGGTLKTGQFFDFSSAKTSINSFYNTLMHATGDKRDRFNMGDSTAETHDPRRGPIEELMA